MKEEQIRKRDIFNRYLKLVAEDIKDLFDFKSFVKIDCPACGGRKFIFEFEQLGFKYVSCRDCLTLFVNPRPSLEMLKRFYSDSSSANYFVNEFFKPVAEVPSFLSDGNERNNQCCYCCSECSSNKNKNCCLKRNDSFSCKSCGNCSYRA